VKRYIELRPDTKIARLGGRPPRVVLTLLIICGGGFLAYAFAEGPAWVPLYLAASAETTLHRLQLYQPFTAVFVQLDARGLLFNMLSLWVFGSALERWWGSRRFLLFWLASGIAGLWIGVWFGLLQPKVILHGPGGTTLAMMVATAVIFSEHLVFFFGLIPIKAKIFSLALAGFILVGNLLGTYFLECAVELGGVAVGLLFLFPPRRWLAERHVKRAKRKLGVIEGGKKDEPKYWN
jgi:membrane associated rhomboid family serine protease